MTGTPANAWVRRAAAAAAWATALWVCFTFSFTPLRASTDEFWHLKTGRWIVENGRLPERDIFTYTAAALPWHNHEWLTQTLMWRLWRVGEGSGVGGWRAVIAVKTLLIMAAFVGLAFALGRRIECAAWPALAAALAAALARRTFYPRPPVVTYGLLALELWLLVRWRAGRLRERWLWALPPLFAVWANLHGGWMAGLVVGGIFWMEQAALAWRSESPEARRRLARLSALAAACAGATLLNPYGFRLYELPLRVGSDPWLYRAISELQPPDMRFVWVLPGTLATLALTAAAGWWLSASTPRARRRWPVFGVLIAAATVAAFYRSPAPGLHTAAAWTALAAGLAWARPAGLAAHGACLAFFAYQGIHHVRHLPLLALVMMPALIRAFEALDARALSDRARRWTRATAWAALVGLAGFWTFSTREGFSYLERNRMLGQGVELQPVPFATATNPPAIPGTLPGGVFLIDPYPVAAMDFLLQADLPGPLWNYNADSGYFIWRLAPERYRLFSDNRFDIFGGRMIREEYSVLEGWTREELAALGRTAAEGYYAWDEVLERWNIQTIVIPTSAAGNRALAASGAWERVYEDFRVNLWVRRTDANRAAIERAHRIPKPPPWRARLASVNAPSPPGRGSGRA